MKTSLFHVGLLALLSPCVAMAQDADESALDALDTATPKPPVVKQEPPGAVELRDAVRRIAQRPTDSLALTDAGYAAIKLGDYDAAFNFFTKANALQPADSRIKAGLGIAQVRRENPFEALSLFDEAIRLGANERSFALDRGLAFDLLGNFERAERDYALAAGWASSDELTLRHAISLSLAGRRDEADRMLIPMLQKENPEAWRARAMMLAARGDAKEAGKIAAGFLPDNEVRRMEGYFRTMARLTPAQQAAAMHFGHFPVGSNIGEDSDSVRTMATATGAKPVPANGDARLIPSGEPLGTKTAAAKADKGKKNTAKDKKPARAGTELATASAQQAVDAAARQTMTPVPVKQLPPPEAARPPVRIALPALTPPKPAPSELPATGPAVLAKGAPDIVKIEIPIDAPALPKKVASDQPTAQPTGQPASQIASVPVKTDAPALPPTVAVATKTVEPVIAESPKAGSPKPDKGPIGPGFDSVGPNIGAPPAISDAVIAPTSPSQDAANPAVPAQNSVTQPVADPTPAATTDVAAKSEDAPVSEKSFNLDALVQSIEVPDDERRPSVAPVDLKKIKTAPPKTDGTATNADAVAKGAKPAITGPRIYVQVATGADAAGLGFDYRRLAKKYPALFTGQEGWTAAWGKTRRLLVGPFTDLKAAKKWEADFRKSGGDAFVWQSDKNTEVEKLKGK